MVRSRFDRMFIDRAANEERGGERQIKEGGGEERKKERTKCLGLKFPLIVDVDPILADPACVHLT